MKKKWSPRTAAGQITVQLVRRYYLHDVGRDSAALPYYLLFALFPLLVFTGDKGASKQAEKTLNKKLSKHIAELNSDIYKEDLSETGGNYRKLYFSYDNVFQGVGLKSRTFAK